MHSVRLYVPKSLDKVFDISAICVIIVTINKTMKYYHKYEYNNIRNMDQLLLRSNINYVIKRNMNMRKTCEHV